MQHLFTKENAVVWVAVCVYKILYLASLAIALQFNADFQTETLMQIRAQWFRHYYPLAISKSASEPSLAQHFSTWDTTHYLVLAEKGYSEGSSSCAFYPLWPLSFSAVARAFGVNPLVCAIFLGNLFSSVALALFYSITRKRYSRDVAMKALLLLIAFPGALFLQMGYSESLFFVALMCLWYGLEEKREGIAIVASIVLPLIRGIGVFSLLPILGYMWRVNKTTKERGAANGKLAKLFLFTPETRKPETQKLPRKVYTETA